MKKIVLAAICGVSLVACGSEPSSVEDFKKDPKAAAEKINTCMAKPGNMTQEACKNAVQAMAEKVQECASDPSKKDDEVCKAIVKAQEALAKGAMKMNGINVPGATDSSSQ